MIAIYRPRDLQLNEKKWIKASLDSRLALSMDVDVVFTTSVAEALEKPVIVLLGSYAHATFHNENVASGLTVRGQINMVGDRIVVSTWDPVDFMKDDRRAKEFLADMLKARIYMYGLGNRNTGYIESVRMSGDGQDEYFSVNMFEKVVEVFESVC